MDSLTSVPTTKLPTNVPTDTSEPTVTPSPQPLEISFEVFFDGKHFRVTGPEEVPTGDYHFLLKDVTNEKVDLYVGAIRDGKTYQDILDRQSYPGELLPKPTWLTYEGKIHRDWNEEMGGKNITFKIFMLARILSLLGLQTVFGNVDHFRWLKHNLNRLELHSIINSVLHYQPDQHVCGLVRCLVLLWPSIASTPVNQNVP
jgi:hypothetical protein